MGGAPRIRLPRPARPLVSVLIPAFRNPELLARCLGSLAGLRRETTPFETVLVLNGAAPAVVDLVSSAVSGATVVPSEVNRGIAGGFNLGAAHARGDYLLLAQDDVLADQGWIEGLLDALARYPEAGAAGSLTLDSEGRLQSAGAVLWRDGSTSPPWPGEPPDPEGFTEPFPVDYCGTCSLMVRRSVWLAIGGADEAFFPAYYVDVDLCLAIRALGRTVLCAPGSRIRHRRGASTSLSFRWFLTGENRRRLLAKWPAALAEQAERSEPLEAALAEAERLAGARARESAERFLEAPPAGDPEPAAEPSPQPAVRSPVDYLRRELELWQGYGEWLEARVTERSEQLRVLEGHYRNLEGHALGLEANLARKDEHIAELERELRLLGRGERP